MWFFQWLDTYLQQAASWFDYAGSVFDSIPVVGSYGGYPFHYIASLFQNCATASRYAGYWSDDIAYQVAVVQNTVNWFAAQSYATLSQVSTYVSNAVASAVQSALNAVYSILNALSASVNSLSSYVWSTLTSAVGDLQARLNAFPSWLLSGADYVAATVWLWITSGRLQNFLSDWTGNLKDAVIGWVVAGMGSLIIRAFDVIDLSWSSFTGAFTWLLMKLISLIFDQAAYFADPLWTLTEKLVEHLTEWKG